MIGTNEITKRDKTHRTIKVGFWGKKNVLKFPFIGFWLAASHAQSLLHHSHPQDGSRATAACLIKKIDKNQLSWETQQIAGEDYAAPAALLSE